MQEQSTDNQEVVTEKLGSPLDTPLFEEGNLSEETLANTQTPVESSSTPYAETVVSDTQRVTPQEEASKIEDLMYSNPAEFARRIKEEARRDVVNEFQNRDREKVFWSEFYGEHPDLKRQEVIVDMIVKTSTDHLKPMVDRGQAVEVKKFLAEKARAIISGVRTESAKSTVLSEGGTEALAASDSELKPVSTAPVVVSFTDQLRGLRKRS